MALRVSTPVLLLGMIALGDISFAANYSVGDKVEAYIQFTWHKATIVRAITDSKFTDYEVLIERADGKKGRGLDHFDVSKDNLRPRGESERLAPRSANSGEGPRLGKYGIYAGSPSVYLGHFVLMPAGRYKVARSSTEEYFGEGEYSFDGTASMITWRSGPFKRNGWGGKFEINNGGQNHRIEFDRTTFGGNYGDKD